MAEASSKQVNVMKCILHEFSNASGQKINLQKSHVFFSENVGELIAQQLS